MQPKFSKISTLPTEGAVSRLGSIFVLRCWLVFVLRSCLQSLHSCVSLSQSSHLHLIHPARFSICFLVCACVLAYSLYVISRRPSTVPIPSMHKHISTVVKPRRVLDAFLTRSFHRVCIRGDWCGLGTVKYPRMHCTFPCF